MSKKFRIAILGLGGVGGYFGGKLAQNFSNSDEVEIIFIARGENGKAIKEKGLTVITNHGEFFAKPNLTTNEPNEIGVVDLLIICTKAYGLEESVTNFKNCIGEKTSVLPLLNGVDHTQTIKECVPVADVWKGCAYIVSRLNAPGEIKVTSDLALLKFGGSNGENLSIFGKLLKTSKIEAELVEDIDKAIWEKFIFISSFATLTSFLNTNAGGINSTQQNQDILNKLINEVTQLAKAKKINVGENIAQNTFEFVSKLNSEITSSMHSDFQKHGETELESLTGYVVRESKSLGLATPVYERLYRELSGRK